MMKNKKSMRFLQFVVLILFISALFAPANLSRYMIAGIAIIGILGTLILLIKPNIPDYISYNKVRRKKQLIKEDTKRIADPETLLWRQISYQITDQLKAAYPMATWDFIKVQNVESLLRGKPFRIRTKNTEEFNFAEVSLDSYGRLNLIMLTMESLKPFRNSVAEEPELSVDTQSWYDLIGKTALIEYIGDLNARGHDRLFINETGEIFIENDSEAELKGTLSQFPPRAYWDELTNLFIQDELDAKKNDGMLELSWAA